MGGSSRIVDEHEGLIGIGKSVVGVEPLPSLDGFRGEPVAEKGSVLGYSVHEHRSHVHHDGVSIKLRVTADIRFVISCNNILEDFPPRMVPIGSVDTYIYHLTKGCINKFMPLTFRQQPNRFISNGRLMLMK